MFPMILQSKKNVDVWRTGGFFESIVSPAMTRTRTRLHGLLLQPLLMLWFRWMWSAISRLFVKGKTEEPAPRTEDWTCDDVSDTVVHVFDAMDRNAGDDRRKGPAGEQQHGGTESEHFSDAYDSRQVKIFITLVLHLICSIHYFYLSLLCALEVS